MTDNALKSILTKEERETFFIAIVSIFLFILCIIISSWIMPENCYLYEYRQIGFLCDAFDPKKPIEPCPICRNETMRTFGQAVLGLGVCFFFIPFIYIFRKKSLNHSGNQPKIFD